MRVDDSSAADAGEVFGEQMEGCASLGHVKGCPSLGHVEGCFLLDVFPKTSNSEAASKGQSPLGVGMGAAGGASGSTVLTLMAMLRAAASALLVARRAAALRDVAISRAVGLPVRSGVLGAAAASGESEILRFGAGGVAVFFARGASVVAAPLALVEVAATHDSTGTVPSSGQWRPRKRSKMVRCGWLLWVVLTTAEPDTHALAGPAAQPSLLPSLSGCETSREDVRRLIGSGALLKEWSSFDLWRFGGSL